MVSTISSFYGSLLIIQVQGILNFKNGYISPTPKNLHSSVAGYLFSLCFTIKFPRKLSLFAISLPYIPIYPGDQNLAAPLKLLLLRPSPSVPITFHFSTRFDTVNYSLLLEILFLSF